MKSRNHARNLVRFTLACGLCAAIPAFADDTPNLRDVPEWQESASMVNPAIDMPGYLAVSRQAAAHRAQRRLTEDQFLRLSSAPGTIILDARSAAKYALLHIKGAVNLSFSDITVDSLAQVLPDRNARILIYCNNNFRNNEAAFPSKMARASLNLSTYIALYTYGYRNVYELAPLLDATTSKLPFESAPTQAVARRGAP